jgi:hypothetical protein
MGISCIDPVLPCGSVAKCRHLLRPPRLLNTRKHTKCTGKAEFPVLPPGPPVLTAQYRAKRRPTNASSFIDDLDGPCRCLATFRATLRSSMNTPPAKLHSRRQDRWHGPLMRLEAGQQRICSVRRNRSTFREVDCSSPVRAAKPLVLRVISPVFP